MGVKLVVAVLGFLLVQEISAQRLIDQMQDLTVREGESVVLLCRFSSAPVDCLWTRGGIVINPRYFKGTYDLAGSMEQGDCSLRIARASFKEDNSLWTCQIPPTLNSQVIQSRPAKLTVMKPPENPFFVVGPRESLVSDGGIISVTDSRETKVTCISENGNPEATLSLYLNDEELPGSESKIDNSTGLYTVRTSVIYHFSRGDEKKAFRCTVVHMAYNGGQVHATGTIQISKFAGFEYALIGGIAGAAVGGLILIALIIYCSYRYRTLCFSAKEKEDEEGGETSLCLSDVENAANADSKDKNLTITADDAQNGKLDGQGNKSNERQIVYADLEMTRNSARSARTHATPNQTPTEYASLQFSNK